MSSIENPVVPSNEMEAKPVNPESDECRKQPADQYAITVTDVFQVQQRLAELMGSDASVEEEDEGPLIGQVTGFLGEESKLKEYFHPSIMSIGPLHYDKNKLEEGQQKNELKQGKQKNKVKQGQQKNELKQSQEFKRQLAKRFIEKNRQKKLTLFNNILNEIETFKKYYDQELLKKFSSDDELAWMFYIDGCALIQLVRYWFDEEFYNIANEQMNLILEKDLLLFENQLPFGVLNLVMGFDTEGRERCQNDHPPEKQSKEFRQSICQFIEVIEIFERINFKRWHVKAERMQFYKANHLLELIWMNLVKKEIDSCSNNIKATPRQFRSVKDLQAAGIILRPDNSSGSLRDISFNQGIFFCKLKIPRFCVSEQGKVLLFNLIAFEMHPNFKKDRVVTSYISFLNSLITTKEDVAELRKAGILLNYLPNDVEVLKTFRELTLSLNPYPDIFSDTNQQVINYFNDKRSMTIGNWLSEATHVYLKSPWTVIAFVSATFLLILTIIQTIFSVLAYQHR